MKQGTNLQDLVAELDRQARSKRDFVTDSRALYMQPVQEGATAENSVRLNLSQGKDNPPDPYGVTAYCHKQFATRLGIPGRYYSRMLDNSPSLLTTNVNHWLHGQPKKVLVRTLDGRARALLSDHYRILDNHDLAQVVLPMALKKSVGLNLELAYGQLTDTHFYLKLLAPDMQGEIKVGDPVRMGVIISNSEVGESSLKIEPLLYTLACKNGMVVQHMFRKVHVQRGQHRDRGGLFEGQDGFAVQSVYSDETKQLDDAAFWSKVRDAARHVFSEDYFTQLLERFRESTERKIENPIQVVDVTAEKHGLGQGERDSVLQALLLNSDLTQYGLANAVTFAAQSVPSHDRSIDLERLGGDIMDLNETQWKGYTQSGAPREVE